MIRVKVALIILTFCVYQSVPDGKDNAYPKLHVFSDVILCLVGLLHAVVVVVIAVHLIRRRNFDPTTFTHLQETERDHVFRTLEYRVTAIDLNTRTGYQVVIVVSCGLESLNPITKPSVDNVSIKLPDVEITKFSRTRGHRRNKTGPDLDLSLTSNFR
uniref:Membrane-associated protein n=1 Tax=Panagrellus redivivus TaxID=6233 RepID=A0A7E4VSZ0_PANRE